MIICPNCGEPRYRRGDSCPKCGYKKEITATNRAWFWPFLWILLIPIVTVPLQSGAAWQGAGPDSCVASSFDLLSGETLWECPVGDVLPTLPGLLNLVAFLWLLSRRRRVRYAALVAGTLGAVRVGVSPLIYTASGPTVPIYPGWGDGPAGAWAASLGLWFLSLVAAIVFPWLVKAEQREGNTERGDSMIRLLGTVAIAAMLFAAIAAAAFALAGVELIGQATALLPLAAALLVFAGAAALYALWRQR